MKMIEFRGSFIMPKTPVFLGFFAFSQKNGTVPENYSRRFSAFFGLFLVEVIVLTMGVIVLTMGVIVLTSVDCFFQIFFKLRRDSARSLHVV